MFRILSDESNKRNQSVSASSRIRNVPIIRIPGSISSTRSNGIPPQFVTDGREMLVAEDAVEKWMQNQPIEMRRLAQHDRIRLKIAGKLLLLLLLEV